ncbi:MAG: M14 family zinc carboxypeptidase [Anaerolineaceae bacterium]|nr:M14 family zinc carboxypeptidase [Anaerolineaceae bacterium]
MKEKIADAVRRVPDYKAFLTVDELNESTFRLAKEHADVVETFEFGKTRSGDTIWGLKIGKGSKNALVFGLPHPNEPVGTMTIEFLSKLLAEDKTFREQFDYTWYFVKAWDSDGARLNEKWFKGPFTLYNYARNFFRPAGHQQVDWTFPIDYKDLHFHATISETKAMMDLIDRIKPAFIYSLHNAGFGGVYWYLTRDIPQMYPAMKEAALKNVVPLHLGEPEAPFCKAMAPAVYKELGIRDEYDYLLQYGLEHPEKEITAGTCSADYAHGKYGTFTMLTELPYFFNEAIIDMSLSNKKRGELFLAMMDYKDEQEKYILENLKKIEGQLSADNPFLLALKAFTGQVKQDEVARKMAKEDPDYQRLGTKAEEFDMLWIAKFYQLLSLGLLLRSGEWEIEHGNPTDKDLLLKVRDDADKRLKEKAAYLNANFTTTVVDIKRLVSIQAECGLLVADYLSKQS